MLTCFNPLACTKEINFSGDFVFVQRCLISTQITVTEYSVTFSEFGEAIALISMNMKVLDAWEDTILHISKTFFFYSCL